MACRRLAHLCRLPRDGWRNADEDRARYSRPYDLGDSRRCRGSGPKAAIEPGQVWVRVDHLDSHGWDLVRSIARMAVVRDLGKAPGVGRQKGSQNRGRLALLERIRAR